MSWAEVKKINSDLSTPLNILATIQHIDMVGENYVGYGDVKGTVEILASDSLYNHMIAKTVLGGVVVSQNAVALAVLANDMAFDKILADADIKSDMGTAIKDNNDVALAVAENDSAFKKCLGDNEVWALASQNSIITAHCETKLSASTGVGEWLAFLADSDNATLKACAAMTAVAASSTAMTAVAASETAMTAVFNSWIAKGEILKVNSAMTVLMTNATSRDWLIANKSEKYTLGLFEWKLQTTKKGLCLRFKHPTSGGADPKIAQADGTKERSGGTTWVDVNQMYIGLKQYGNCTCDFVLMEQ